MEAATLRSVPARPAPVVIDVDVDWDWIYEDPDLAPYRAGRRRRPEVPLSAFV